MSLKNFRNLDTVLYHDVSNHRIDINSGNLYREMNIQNSVYSHAVDILNHDYFQQKKCS